MPVPRREASCLSRMPERVWTPFCIVSSNTLGDLKGALALSSITCSWSSLPKVNSGCSTKLTVFPQYCLMTLSAMGRGLRFSFTSENSCSGPRTSRVLYVCLPSNEKNGEV